MAKQDIPKHVAIIMDGNGRWAKEKGLMRTAGHYEGVKRVREIVKTAADTGVEFLTLFAFSNENWSRPEQEVSTLMRFFSKFLDKEITALHKNNIRFRAIGRKHPLPQAVLSSLEKAQKLTADNTGLTMVLAINYGSRQEIIDAVKDIYQGCLDSRIKLADIDQTTFGSYLYTAGLPDPDLLIRTSGEQRISNFLLWQISYAELYFSKKHWPDFKRPEFLRALKEYSRRQRRFGGI